MDKSDYQAAWLQAMSSGTLLTPKHDPASVGVVYVKYRTVLSNELADNLESFVQGGQFNVIEYANTNHPQSPLYVEIVPTDPNFSVPGSGIPAYGSTPTSVCDRLIAVSGTQQGWHLHAESSAVIAGNVASGILTLGSPLP